MPELKEHWSPGSYQSDRERAARYKQEAKTYPQPTWEERMAASPDVFCSPIATPAPKPKPHPDHTPSGSWDK